MPHAPPPTFDLEDAAVASGAALIAGVDEVGRGPLAGPVVAAAVILDRREDWTGIADSKTISAGAREAIFERILSGSHVAVASVSAAAIDELDIRAATLRAMREAVLGLPVAPGHILIDGNALPSDLPCNAQAIVKGDARSVSIAAASIAAKVVRDRMMVRAEALWPGYGFAAHKGYGSKAHRNAIATLGPCPIHRMTFAPLKHL